jgi:hypothetical protein
MGLQVALINFSPNTTIKSADVNANFQQVLNATKYYGELGSGNNINVTISIEDTIVNYWNGHQSCSRWRGANDSDDRSFCYSMHYQGVIYDSLIFDFFGNITFLTKTPTDYYGNPHHCGTHFSGFGSGFYSHGMSSTDNIPYTFQITVHDTTYARVRCSSVGVSTVRIDMEASVNIKCHCIHYY